MEPSLRVAVELPPVPADGTVSIEPWVQTALAAVRAGAGTIWFTGGPSTDGTARSPRWCDACTVAAGTLPRVADAILGVVSSLPEDRHPAVLARDVTTLDVLSGGRAAVLLRWGSASGSAAVPGGLPATCAYLGEGVGVCRAVLQDDDPVFEGRFLHVAGAVNRPPPARPGGPPILVHVPSGVTGLARRDPDASFLLRQVAAAATAIVCPDEPAEIAAWRALLEDAAGALWTEGAPDGTPGVVCRTTLRPAAARSARPTDLRSRLATARDAGATGVLVRLPADRRGDRVLDVDAGDAGILADDLGVYFEPWRA